MTTAGRIADFGNHRDWTDEEIGFLIDHDDWPADRIGLLLGRSRGAVYLKRHRLKQGWTPTRSYWSEMECDVVRATTHLTAREVAALLPGRTADGVLWQRRVLGAWHQPPWQVGSRPLLAKTCPCCGLLLQARWFSRSTGLWSTNCIRCKGDKTKQRRTSAAPGTYAGRKFERRLQAKSLEHAKRRGEPWSTDARTTEVLADPDLTAFEKSVLLERSWSGVQQRVKQLGFKSKVGLGDPLQGTWVISLPGQQHLQEAS